MVDNVDVYKAIEPLIERIRNECFVKSYEATDAECVSLIVSKYFHWNGFEIGKVATGAFEDANFHDLANKLQTNLDEEFSYEEVK
tara:strand:+ start:162 stop:416 length:255 start_codon:yes stop_codon:yes gene_type:complete